MRPIVGKRYECRTCPEGPDNNLCEACFASFQRGIAKHPAPGSLAEHLNLVRHEFRAFEGKPHENYLHWLNIPQSSCPAPSQLPGPFVVRPEFCSGSDSFFGGYAFVIKAEDGGMPLVLTALHVMDELIKSKGIDCTAENRFYTGHELPRHVKSVNLYDVFATNWMIAELGSASSMLILPDARVSEEEPYSQQDIAAFRANSSLKVTPATLASSPPALGEPLWLLARSETGAAHRPLQAVVVEVTERTMIFRYQNSTLPRYCSGAPLVNCNGAVVGINVGGGKVSGEVFGHANHATSIRRHLNWLKMPMPDAN
jgi:hypothetical protein